LAIPTERNETSLLIDFHLFRTYCSNINSYRVSLEAKVWTLCSLHLRFTVKIQKFNLSSYLNTRLIFSQKFDVFHLGACPVNCEKWPQASPHLSASRSVCMEQLGSHWTDFSLISIFQYFSKIFWEINFSLKSENNNNGYFTWRPIYILMVSRSVLLRIRNISYKHSTENKKTHFCSITLFFENLPRKR